MSLKRSFTFSLATGCTLLALYSACNPAFAAKTLSNEALQKKALAVAPGTIGTSNEETLDGRELYFFQVKGADGYLHNIQLDTHTGEVVSHKTIGAQGKEIESGGKIDNLPIRKKLGF